MLGYDYKFQYIKGINNSVADVLSRTLESESLLNLAVSTMSTNVMNRVAASWHIDEKLAMIIKELESGSSKHAKYNWIEGILKSKEKVVVGHDLVLRKELMYFFHGSVVEGHYGAKDVAQIFLLNIFKLHGLPNGIIRDKDKVFMSLFCRELLGKL
ncbi:hypothetical protein HRI_002070500 [Hibiscus trionum]|uniref:Uncharacterized protein n=1 Tax=Hibiscus trionum TaxID=183268 RepID=A0A9W7HW26_HIBTR|nr:hypothetical protein HRI_002070500 [Hibiscus trionum]